MLFKRESSNLVV